MLAMFCAITIDANAAGALLRISCEGDDVGAEVFINGKFKGECPVDIQAAEGMLVLRAVKKIDAQSERVFEQNIRVAEGTIKKIEVQLSAARLNAEAQQREDQRQLVERIKAEKREAARQAELTEQRKRDGEMLLKQTAAAEAGESTAMMALGDRYAAGNGVAKDEARAKSWYEKAAAAGNAVAAFKLSDLYKAGKKADVDAALKLLALPLGEVRSVTADSAEKIRALVTSDPFFAVPGDSQKIAWNNDVIYGANSQTMHNSIVCVRNGRFFQIDSKSTSTDFSATGETVASLGGLLALDSKLSYGLFKNNSSLLTGIEKLFGQPFPLKSGIRFAVAYTVKSTGAAETSYSAQLSCAAVDEARVAQGGAKGQPVTCLEQTKIQGGLYQSVRRLLWHEPSGCFINGDK